MSAVHRPFMPAPADFFKGWGNKPWYEMASGIAEVLQWKGMCILETELEPSVLEQAVKEISKMKDEGKMTKPYKEVLGGLFGAAGSCWTHELPLLDEDADIYPTGEEALRQVEKALDDLGMGLETTSFPHFGMVLEGRTTAVVHRTRTSADVEPHPPLEDPKEADAYVNLFCRKKLKLLMNLGPDNSIITVLRHDKHGLDKDMNAWRATLNPGHIVVVRGDIAVVSELNFVHEETELAYTLEIDFLAEQRRSLQLQRRDVVPCPDDLDDWFKSRVSEWATNKSVNAVSDDDWMRVARQQYCKKRPVQILQVAHEMPFVALRSDAAPSSATHIGSGPELAHALALGVDCVAEVPASRWDVDAYYDEDVKKVDSFKMYTRHIGCLDLNVLDKFDFQEFGLSKQDVESMDKRQNLLTSTAIACLNGAGWRRSVPETKNMGVYCGLPQSDAYMGYFSGDTKLSKAAEAGIVAPSGANRLAYLLACGGPSVTVDTNDSSGSAALDAAICGIRVGRCGPALVSSVNLLLHPFSVILLCGARRISRAGRSKVFDSSSDGMARSEGCVSLLLQDHEGKRKDDSGNELQFEDFSKCGKLIAGSALNTQGVSSSVTAANGTAIQEVMRLAFNDGETAASLLDGTQVNAGGRPLVDALELGIMRNLTHSKDLKAGTCVLHTAKSLLGDAGAPAGLMALASACALMEHGVHAPCIHLRQLLHPAILGSDVEASMGSSLGRLHIPLEAVEARTAVQTIGVSSFGDTGTNVHHVLWGKRFDSQGPSVEPRPLQWWPAAEYSLTPEDMSHYIIGTWSAWGEMEQMRIEPDGTYCHNVTLGENGWEAFQIFFQGQKSQCYHPEKRWGGSECKVRMGADVDRSQVFVLDGRPKRVQLLNAHQVKVRNDRIEAARKAGAELPEWEFEGISCFSADYKPEDCGDVGEDGVGMPVVDKETEMWGVPGDKYVIRFHHVGQYRRMQLVKVPRDYKHFEFFPNRRMPTLDHKTVRHAYYITGEHNEWGFDALTASPNEEGLFEGEIKMNKGSTLFRVVRDRDLDQTFYPVRHEASQAVAMRGPDGSRPTKAWKIDGKPGDVVKVSFRRVVAVGKHEEDDERAARMQKRYQDAVEAHKLALKEKHEDIRGDLDIALEHGILNEEQYEEEQEKLRLEFENADELPDEKDFLVMERDEQIARMKFTLIGIKTETLSMEWKQIGQFL